MADFRYLDETLKNFVQNGPAGCGCMVMQNGKILYEGYHGYADIEAQKPITADTVYRQYSMTKIAIYTACMMLLEQGKILLSDPIYDYFPEWKNTTRFCIGSQGEERIVLLKNPICVEHIMNMSCGLPYGHFSDGTPTGREICRVTDELKGLKEGYTLRDEIRAVSVVPVAFEPGEHWLYGFGSELAAGLIEEVTGKRIQDALKEMIFDPLEMKSTGMIYFGDIESRLAIFYNRTDEGKLIPGGALMDEKSRPGEKPMGCPRLFSTVPDFAVFAQTLANGGKWGDVQLLSSKTIDLMRTNRLNKQQLCDFQNDYLDGYGYGLGVRTMIDRAKGGSNSSLGEFGWTGGSGTWVSMDPEEKTAIVYMHQLTPNMERYHHLRIRACVYGALR